MNIEATCPNCGCSREVDEHEANFGIKCPSCDAYMDISPAGVRDRPRLWNPNAAACWSLLFTPAFGAYLHAANWRALGKPERATVNLIWVGASVVFAVVIIGTVFAPASKVVEGMTRFAGLGLLLGWYINQGRAQAQYVKENFGDNYDKKGWGVPLLTGVAAIGVYCAVIFFLVFAVYKPDAAELVAEVKPLILEEWQKEPELRGASIQNITLTHKGGKLYSGFVDATLAGQSVRLSLEVVYENGTIAWELKPQNK